MAKSIDIKIGSSFNADGILEANKGLAKLAQDVDRSNAALRQATLKAASDINSYAEAADKACRAMGGGYKDAAQFVREAMGEYTKASSSVKAASGAFGDFSAILKKSAEAVDRRNANIKQAAEVSKALESAQRKLSAITDTSSDAYRRASRNVEILKQALSSLGVNANAANKPVQSVPSVWRGAFAKATGHVRSFVSSIGRNLMNIQAGFQMASRAVRTFAAALSKGMEFERMTVQFKSLTGSMELARAHMKDLQDLGRTPPFSLEQFAAASQAMLKMTGGMAGFKKEMEIVGDMAAATGNDIATVGRAFGLAYQVIRDGQDFGRAGQQLYTLGIMTKKQVAEFAEMSKAGTDNATVWEKLVEVFGRYKGAMAETEKTTKGVVEAIQGEATVAMTDFSEAISDSAKPALEGLLGWLKRINEDGSIEDWADRAVDALGTFGNAIRSIYDLWKGSLGTVFAFARGADKAFHEDKGFMDQLRAGKENAMRYYNGEDEDPARAEKKRNRAEEKKLRRAEQAADAEDEAQKRMADDLAAAQKKRDDAKRAENYDEYVKSGSTDTFDTWLAAKEKAKAEKLKADKELFVEYQKKNGIDSDLAADDVEEADEAFKIWRTNHDKQVEEERKANEDLVAQKAAAEKSAEAERHALAVANIQSEIKAKQDAESATQAKAQYAQTEFDRAFGMYRSEDHGAAQIAEERDYAADYKQLHKDAARYGGKWRIDELASLMEAGDTKGQAAKLEEWRKSKSFTPEVESMVRAAAADQTKTTAEDELRKINENTKNLADKLDQLLQVK